ncbi:biotin/lipoyl-binding protein [Herbaspirillum sp.]|uniref:biotin/lipoyl-binding protein n=1 Tax=Herbaspirillum sp. TaxID=1890675 RepID=UPI0031D9C793
MASVLLLLIWAAVSHIDQVTRAQGQVIAVSRTQSVQAPDGGPVKQILVKEGEAVKQGQLLMVLEQDRIHTSLNDSRAKVAALRISLARLRAEVYGHLRQRTGIAATSVGRRQDASVGIDDALHQRRGGGLYGADRLAGQRGVDRAQIVGVDPTHADGGIIGGVRQGAAGVVGVGVDLQLGLDGRIHQGLQFGQRIDGTAVIGAGDNGLGHTGLQGIVEIDHAEQFQPGLQIGRLVGVGAALQRAAIARGQGLQGVGRRDQLAELAHAGQLARSLADQRGIDQSLGMFVMRGGGADQGVRRSA